MTYQVHLTPKSKNRKVGKMPVSTTSADTCPDDCPFKGNGCYAYGYPLKGHWDKVTDRQRGVTWPIFVGMIRDLLPDTLWRHNQAGDLPGQNNKLDATACFQLADANTGKRGFTYCHYDVLYSSHNRNVIEQMNKMGFVVNLSGNSLDHADKLADLDIAPVTTVLPSDQMTNTVTPAGRKVVVCPAVIRDDVSCETCQLCARQRDFIIGFPAHGTSKKKADAVANG